MRLTLFKHLFIAALIGAFFIAGCSSYPTEEKVVNNWLQAIAAEDFDTAVDMIHLSNVDPNLSLEVLQPEFKNVLKSLSEELIQAKGGIQEIEIIKTEHLEDKNQAVVTYNLHFKDGSSAQDLNMELIKIDGQWKPHFDFKE